MSELRSKVDCNNKWLSLAISNQAYKFGLRVTIDFQIFITKLGL